MTVTANPTPYVGIAQNVNKRAHCDNDTVTNHAKRQRLLSTIPSGDQLRKKVEGATIYAIKDGQVHDLSKDIFSKKHLYLAQINTTWDYLKDHPAIRHFISLLFHHLSTSQRKFPATPATEQVKEAGIPVRMKAVFSDVVDIDFGEGNLLVLIKLQSETHPTPIQYITSDENRKELDAYLGEVGHLLLRIIACRQGPSQSSADVPTTKELGRAIDEIEQILSPFIIHNAQWKLNPDKLFEFSNGFTHLDKNHKKVYHATWHLWKGEPRKALEAVGSLDHAFQTRGLFPKIRANYDLGNIDEARRLRTSSSSLAPLQSAACDLLDLATQQSTMKTEALKSLTNIFSHKEPSAKVKNPFLFYAMKGCFLYHASLDAQACRVTGEHGPKSLMTEAIKSWEESLKVAEEGKTGANSINSYIATLTLCALTSKYRPQEAKARLTNLKWPQKQDIIRYYPYISNEWPEMMYDILRRRQNEDLRINETE